MRKGFIQFRLDIGQQKFLTRNLYASNKGVRLTSGQIDCHIL